jgi:hypothetical protein
MINTYSINYQGNELSREVIDFIKENHYSGSARSQQQVHIFTLHNRNKLSGVALYGKPISRNADNKSLELRRFCLSRDCEKNTASFFISKTIRWLQQNEFNYNHITSYADPNKGHQGIMYKAANFLYDGLEKNNPRVVIYQGREYHLRQFYQKSNGHYDENALRLQELVRKGEAQIVKQDPKHRYIYKLR